jgi:hypothetical protein
LTLTPKQKKIFELTFAAVFSAVVLVLFYSIISMNGLVLGNDPAVHLEKAQLFLRTGKISLANLGWTPPLYQILLATLISFMGASNFEQMIVLVKAAAVLIDWLLFLSVYLISSKFFGKKIGAIAAVLLLMCFPMYEINLWGGYTSVLGLAFMLLLFLYLPLAAKDFGYVIVTFLAGFSLVLSHQLATFLTVLILSPVILFILIKSRGAYLKALIALILGGGIAFFLYYWQATIAYVDVLVEHVFLMNKTMLYQIPATTLNAFMVNFGFVFIIALGGIFIAFFNLRAKKKFIPYLILFLSFIVPLVLAESYLFGLYLPFQWFIYYLMPPMAVLAAVAFAFIMDHFSTFYVRYKKRWKALRLKTVTISLIILIFSMFMFRFGVVYGKIMEASVYYSTSDMKAYNAGVWLSNNFPDDATVVVTEIPGFWFRAFSGKTIIAATNPVMQGHVRDDVECVFGLSYELEHPLTLVKAYEAKGDENCVSINDVWTRVSYSSGDGNFISYRANGVDKETALSGLNREIVFEDQSFPKKLIIHYFNDEVNITQTILVQNDSYPINVAWTLSPLKSEVSNTALYVSTFFDLHFSFEKAYIPDVLDWENPWSRPSNSQGNDWAVVNFSRSTLTDNYLGFYDEKEKVVFALNFKELPDWGNVGVLTSRQIDAVRFQYNFDKIDVNQTAFFTYQVLTFSKSSCPEIQQPNELKSLFEFKPLTPFEVKSRDYQDFVNENKIKFIVYDKNQFDTKIIRCKILELVYSNDRYVIFRVKSNPLT